MVDRFAFRPREQGLLAADREGSILDRRKARAGGHGRLRMLLLSAVLCLLAGCSSRPEGVLRPVGAAPNAATRVDMLVATTRRPSDDPGQLYSGERGTAISFNSLLVSIPPAHNRKIGEVQWPVRVPADPEREFAVLGVRKVASEQQALGWFRKNRNVKRQAVVFVHGFNTSYADAVFRFAQLICDGGIDAAPILFTWPSRASVFDYLYDKESTTYSRRALEDLILEVARSPDVGEITILSHSMGTWLTMEALRGVAMRAGTIPAKVSDVALASPDIDIDVFRRQLIELGARRPRFTVLVSTADRALDLSRWLAGGIGRVGGTDPTPHAELIKQLGITVIDTTASASRDGLGHNAFADSPEIVALLGRQLSGRSLLGGGIVAAGAGGFSGSAGGTAPVLPVTAASRTNGVSIQQEPPGMTRRIVDGRAAY